MTNAQIHYADTCYGIPSEKSLSPAVTFDVVNSSWLKNIAEKHHRWEPPSSNIYRKIDCCWSRKCQKKNEEMTNGRRVSRLFFIHVTSHGGDIAELGDDDTKIWCRTFNQSDHSGTQMACARPKCIFATTRNSANSTLFDKTQWSGVKTSAEMEYCYQKRKTFFVCNISASDGQGPNC